MHRRLSCPKVHPRCCRSLCWKQTPLYEDLLDEMDIQEALTLALRIRRHQFDANTGNLRSSAQIAAQIDPRSASPSDGSDPIQLYAPSILRVPHDCVYAPSHPCRNEASSQLRTVAQRAPCGCARARRGTFNTIRLLHFFIESACLGARAPSGNVTVQYQCSVRSERRGS